MKKDLISTNDIKMSELRDYILQFNVNKEELYECWSMRSLLKKVSFIDHLYDQCLKALTLAQSYDEMEVHLIMMNKLFHTKEYEDVKKELFTKLLQRHVGLSQYCVIRHLIQMKKYDFELLMNRLYASHLSTILEIVKMCLIEEHYDLAYSYLKILDYCEDEIILDMISQHSVSMYYRLMFHYQNHQHHSLLLQYK